MKKIITILAVFTSLGLYAQNNVGIGTLTPNSNAKLEIKSDDKGVLITRLTTIARNTLGTALTGGEDGMLVYDKDLTAFYYWDGPNLQWVQVGSGAGDNWGTQTVQTNGANISGDGTTTNPITVTDGDSDATNEIELPTGGTNGQVLTTDGSGVYTWVNDDTGTDDQNIANLAFNNATNILTVGIENGTSQTIDLSNLVNDADSDITNEIQDLSINTTTNILTITNNGSATNIDLSSYLDNTDAQNIAGSSFTTSTGDLVIGISNGTAQTVNLNGLKDHDWYEVGTTRGADNINDNIFTQGNVGINTASPTEKLEVNGSVKITDGTQGVGKVLTSDANGKASWQNGTSQPLYSGTWDMTYADQLFTTIGNEFTGLSLNLPGGRKYLVFVRAGIVVPGTTRAWKYLGYGINSTTVATVMNFLGGETSFVSETEGCNYVDDTSF